MLARCLLARANLGCLKSSTKHLERRTIYSNVKPLSKECSDIEIEVPWGKLSGKLWGSENEQPILAVHGWQDNAGTFDSLAPLLLKNASSILAIDFPGHGFSSWLPPGMMYTELVYMSTINRLKRYFGWKKIKILGHSLGAQLAFWHTSIFSEDTEFVIAIDALKFFYLNPPQFNAFFIKGMDDFYKLENSEYANRSYTKNEIMERWKQNSASVINNTEIQTLMTRGARETPEGKFVLTRDPRTKFFPLTTPFTHSHMQECARCIGCPYLYIKGEQSPYFDQEKNVYDILSIMKEHNKDVHFVKVPGEHHLHISNAEQVAHHINKFLEKYNK